MNDIATFAGWQDVSYEREETRQLVRLVNDAADLVGDHGEIAFNDFGMEGSRWRLGDTYVFVLDPEGNMLVHPDPELEKSNVIALRDLQGKPIIRGLLNAAMGYGGKGGGWYHYQWPVPGAILPRWKSSYVRLVTSPTGRRYIVGSGVYDDRMERAFVVHMVNDAVAEIEQSGVDAFPLLRDPTGPFIAKDGYVFVYHNDGTALVLPPFPTLEGKHLIEMQDTSGKYIVREMLDTVQMRKSGWVNYLWPKPGESVSTQKSAYVRKAKMGGEWVLVGCSVYLADAPRLVAAPSMSAPQLVKLVHDAALVLERQGEEAYSEFRRRGSKWFHDETYFFVLKMDGLRVLLPPDPLGEGINVSEITDEVGRPFVRMMLDIAKSPLGEGWVHYMFPLPGGILPAWKSAFVKRVIFPSGAPHVIGCGVYHMQMDRAIIEDLVNRAAVLIELQGRAAFPQLRDKGGPFYFMDTYLFVEDAEGTELVNPALPALEGKNLVGLKDLAGNELIRDQRDLAMREGCGWLQGSWYKPGRNTPALKLTYVRKVQYGGETFIIGSGIYPE